MRGGPVRGGPRRGGPVRGGQKAPRSRERDRWFAPSGLGPLLLPASSRLRMPVADGRASAFSLFMSCLHTSSFTGALR